MHAISRTHPHTHTHTHTHRQGRLQYTAPQLARRVNISEQQLSALAVDDVMNADRNDAWVFLLYRPRCSSRLLQRRVRCWRDRRPTDNTGKTNVKVDHYRYMSK